MYDPEGANGFNRMVLYFWRCSEHETYIRNIKLDIYRPCTCFKGHPIYSIGKKNVRAKKNAHIFKTVQGLQFFTKTD